jgi:MFS family permease
MTEQTTIDVHQELAEAKVGSLHKWLGVMMATMTLFDGYDTFNPAYVIHYVAGPWGLAPSQAGLLISSGLVGFLIGAATHGLFADRIGRRNTLLGGMWITSIFTLATPLLGHSFASFCTLRVLTGIGLGVLLPLATTYINELAPRKIANTFTLWGVGLGWSLGGTMAGVVGVYLTPHFGWEVLYWVGALSIPFAIALHFFLPESIPFLALKGRTEEIRVLLARLRPERAALYRTATLVLPKEVVHRNPVSALLKPGLRRTTLTIWLAAFLSLFCIFGLTGWIPTVMMKRGETFAVSFGFGALMQIMSFVGGLACGHLADRRGSSRVPLAIWWAIGGLSVLTLSVLDGHVVNITCVAAAGYFGIGAQFVLNNFTAGSYRTGIRATGVGMMLSVGRIGAILGPFVAGTLQQVYGGPDAMFVTIGCASIVAAIAILSLSGTSRGGYALDGAHLHGHAA